MTILSPDIKSLLSEYIVCSKNRAVKVFLNTIVSGKVTRKGKLKLINSLSELGKDIDITR